MLLWTSVSSVQLLSCVRFFGTPRAAAHQASPSITNFRSLLKLMSIESVMAIQTSHPLSSSSPPAFNLSQHQGIFKWVSSLHQVVKVLDRGVLMSFQIRVLSEYLPKSGITESYGSLFLVFWGTSMLFSIEAAPIYIPISHVEGILFLHNLPACYLYTFLMMASLTGLRWCLTIVLTFISLIISNSGNSLVVQWLRLCTSTAEGMDSIPGQRAKILHAMGHGHKIN